MNKNTFSFIKELFPHSKPFNFYEDNNLKKFVKSLCVVPSSIRENTEKVYLDFFPFETRSIEKWDKTFALYFTQNQKEKERNIIDAFWKIISGNESPDFIESILKNINSDFFVLDNTPLTDPRDKQYMELAICDYPSMVCGNDKACCDYYEGDRGFTPEVLQNDQAGVYSIPNDKRFWQTCFFVCREIVRAEDGHIIYIEPIDLDKKWKPLVELIILKIKPVQMSAVLYIRWHNND